MADLLTLRTAAKQAGISTVTARKYMAREPGRVPSTGEGRKRRYPQEAAATFKAMRVEGDARHGRPRGDGGAVRRRR